MRRPSLLRVALVLLLSGCGSAEFFLPPPDDYPRPAVCSTDAQCDGDRVCFLDGCGDPGQNLAVEITPEARAGRHAQDFPVPELKGTQNFELFGPAVLTGHITRAAPEGGGVAFVEPVTVRATGASDVIPGLTRRFTVTVSSLEGRYVLSVASGRYTVELVPTAPDLPPLREHAVAVGPGQQRTLDFQLPGAEGLVRLEGRLVGPTGTGLGVPMVVQALGPDGMEELSQPGQAEPLTGTFHLTVAEASLSRSPFLIRAAPLYATSFVPTRLFEVSPVGPAPLELDMGAFGMPVEVSGRAVDARGQPLEGATVYLRGLVQGGGTFRSESVRTDAQGAFRLQALASAPGLPMDLWVVPPLLSRAGLLLVPVEVGATGDTLQLGEVVLTDKVLVEGTVRLPTGEPAPNVLVSAQPVAALPGSPLPASGAEGLTDTAGVLRLELDPGEYRLDFIPSGGELPRVSRFIAVGAASIPHGDDRPRYLLDTFQLSRGRIVRGTVTAAAEGGALMPAGFATVRFFRVVSLEEGPSAMLLAETTTDASGHYTVVLPTR